MKITRTALAFGTAPFAAQLCASVLAAGRVIGWGISIAGEATAVPTAESPSRLESSTGVVMIADEALTNVVAVAAGRGHSLALTSEGSVFGWGANLSGEVLGVETPYPYRTNGQVRIGGHVLENVMAISAGGGFSLAVRSNSTVVSWGGGLEKVNRTQIDVPSGLTNVTAVAAGWNYSMALQRDGTVVGWGVRRIPAGLSHVVSIAAGGGYYAPGLALKGDGTVVEWTTGGTEERVPPQATNVVAIAAGESHSLALRGDGTVVGWGGNQFGAATGVPTRGFASYSNGVVSIGGRVLSNVVAIAAGHEFSLALKRDGTVVAWGYNGFHQTDMPADLANVVAIPAGENFCLAITTNSGVLRFKK